MVAQKKLIVDEVTGWLRIFDDGTVDRTWTGPPEALLLMQAVQPYDAPRDGVTLHELPGDPALRLYLPSPRPEEQGGDADRQALPVILHFHGGGFCLTNCSWLIYHQFYSRVAATLSAVVISVDLPLAPEHRLPAAIDAGFAALIRLRSIASSASTSSAAAEELLRSTADFSHVFLIGDSSGGNLVHLVASRAGEVAEEGFWSPLKLAGGILLNPGFVRSTRSQSEIENPDSVFLTLDMIDKLLALGLPEGATKDHPYTCPMDQAAPPLENARLPPFLVAVAEKDLMRDTNLEYYEAMKAAGKEVEVVMSEGVSHVFHLNKFAVDSDPTTAKRTEELVMAIKDFVGRH